MYHHHCWQSVFLKRQRIPLQPLTSLTPTLTRWPDTPYPYSIPLFAFYLVDSTVLPLQTTINMSAPDDRAGPGTFYIN